MTEPLPTPSVSPESPVGDMVSDSLDWLTTSGTHWSIWLAVAAGLFVGVRALRALLTSLIATPNDVAIHPRNVLAALIRSTKTVTILVFSLSVTAPFFVELSGRVGTVLSVAATIAAIVQVAIWIRVIALAVVDGVIEKNAHDTEGLRSARNLIRVLLNIVIVSIAGMMVIDNLGGDVTGLIAGFGVGGIAIGLAAQNIFKDLFASLSIILDRPFAKGDFIQFGNFNGTVDRIGLKTTRLVSLTGEQLVVGNDQLLSMEIQNYRRMHERRVVLKLGVLYSTPRDVLEALPTRIREVVEAREAVRFDRCHLADYGDCAIVFEAVYWVQSRDYTIHMDEKQVILLGLHSVFAELGAEFAFPTQTVIVEGMTG